MMRPHPDTPDELGPHFCSLCGEQQASHEELLAHRRDGHFTAADRGPTGTTASGHSGSAPPVGTGGAATP